MADFHPVAPLKDLPELGGKEVILNGHRVCLFKNSGTVYAVAAECPHRGAPLAAGWVENGRVYCALHGWEFDLRTGECHTKCTAQLLTYAVRVQDGMVEIALPAE